MQRLKNLKKSMKNSKQKAKKKMERQILFVTCFFSGLFLGLIGYITYYSATHKQELLNNSYNGRQRVLVAQNRRGSIYSADGEVLARTVVDENGKEVREYPYQNLFAHVVGYAGNGRMGVEDQANYYLINSNAPLSQKASVNLEEEKYPGDNVYTTLDVNLQQVASTALGVYQGAIIVTEPDTGRILAMVSKPDFNPEEISQIWEELVSDEDSSVLLNRVTQGLYPPGSTFKIVTALEYIREHPDNYNSYNYTCNGSIRKGEDRIQCYHGSVHGTVNFVRSFAKSCNTSFANIGLNLDRDSFANTLSDLMFNAEFPLDMNYSKSRVTMGSEISDSDMMQASIGQGTIGVSPMHMNMITCAIANHGTLMKPYVVDRVENSAGSVVKSFSPSVYRRIISEEEAATLTGLMEDVVTEGTATRLKGLSYTAAGKTGSAEYGTVKGESHAWFTGFAPVENPQICVTIIIEGAGAGGDYAVPIAKRIFDAYFDV